MKYDNHYRKIIGHWAHVDIFMPKRSPTRDVKKYQTFFMVIDRHGNNIEIPSWYQWYKDPESSKLAFGINKNHWAVGRKLKIESKLDGIPSGEYVIVHKLKSNSYDKTDFITVEPVKPVTATPRKALNWLEKQLEELEARDGITTEQLVKEMNVRGY